MLLPRAGIFNDLPGAARQGLHRGVRQPLLAHVSQSGVVDPIARVTGTEQFQEIDPALTGGGLKPGKMGIANLCDVTVLALMPCARVIDSDIGGRRESALEQRIFFLMKGALVGA